MVKLWSVCSLGVGWWGVLGELLLSVRSLAQGKEEVEVVSRKKKREVPLQLC